MASLPTNGTMALTMEELHEITECEKIVRFRDEVLAGKHPRIKVPAHLNGKSATGQTSSPSSLTPRSNPQQYQIEPKSATPSTNNEDNQSPYNSRSSNSLRVETGKGSATMPLMAKAEINPILLEKSDDLIKAEIQLQRQRLERALREQVEQRRLSLKASLQTAESLPDFDLSDVLFKALTVVHPSTTAEAEKLVGDHSSASDSFDENTFYSSQHDTPEHSTSSQEHRWPHESPAQTIVLPVAHAIDNSLDKHQEQPRDMVMADASMSNTIEAGVHQSVHKPIPLLRGSMHGDSAYTRPPGLNASPNIPAPETGMRTFNPEVPVHAISGGDLSAPDPMVHIQSNTVVATSSKHPEHVSDLLAAKTGALLKQKFFESESSSAEILEPAIIRTRDDVPTLAPQPARVSPLVTARAPPILGQSMMADEEQVTQVTAKRKSVAVSSPESSPKGARPSEKKKIKKKKTRKSSGKQAVSVDTPDSPYIKPEPRSPSPFSAPPLPRPLPRQRQTLQQETELNYDEPRYEVQREEHREIIIPSRYRGREVQRSYNGPEEDRLYEPRETKTYGYRPVARDEKQYRRVVSHNISRGQGSPSIHATPYSPNDPRPMRAASHAVVDRSIPDPPRWRDVAQQEIIRIDADRERSRSPVMRERGSPALMGPPRQTRIFEDEYGRQFYAPPPIPISSRQSVAPSMRPGDEDVIYERPALRSVARPVSDFYEEDGVIYKRPSVVPSSPQWMPSRRVVTQPEQEMDYRAYRQREYSTRPPARAPPSADELIRVREPLDRRQMSHFEEVPREQTARIGSVRPESIRYGVPREFVERVQSVRPEAHSREYAQSVRPEARREMTTRHLREFSVRPGEPEIIRREYMPQTESDYAVPKPVVRRVIEEPEYIERRRVPQDMYVDDVRREVVYR